MRWLCGSTELHLLASEGNIGQLSVFECRLGLLDAVFTHVNRISDALLSTGVPNSGGITLSVFFVSYQVITSFAINPLSVEEIQRPGLFLHSNTSSFDYHLLSTTLGKRLFVRFGRAYTSGPESSAL